MANPVTLGQIETVMRALGWTDIDYSPGASTADRPGDFKPIGVTIHITAGGLGSRTEQQYIRDIINGDPGVPLKANAVGGVKGRIWLNAVGNGNHCLYFGSKGRALTLRQAWPIRPGWHDARGRLTKWSTQAYGIEMIASSGANVTDRMRQAAIIWAAAICILHGWSAGVVHGHGEIAYDRSSTDPGIDMGRFRMDVQTVLDNYYKPATGRPGTGGDTSQPIDPEEIDMAKADELQAEIDGLRKIIEARTSPLVPGDQLPGLVKDVRLLKDRTAPIPGMDLQVGMHRTKYTYATVLGLAREVAALGQKLAAVGGTADEVRQVLNEAGAKLERAAKELQEEGN